MWLLVIAILIFIFLSGVLAMVDAAVLSVSRAETEEMVAKRLPGSGHLRNITGQITRTLVVIVVITNTINILGPILVGQVAVTRYGPRSIGWITLVLTLATILFSEIIPKSLGSHYAPYIGRYSALPIRFATLALYPIVVLLDVASQPFKRGKRRVGTEEQIRALADLGRRAGYIEPDEGLLVHRTFILNDRTAGDIMTPLERVVGVRLDDAIKGAAQRVYESEYSRYPVFGTNQQDCRGFVLARDILREVAQGRGDQPLASILREGVEVATDRRCDHLLNSFRLRHLHLALVKDGDKTVGVVTLEDVLEELVGEIEDEKDEQT